MCLYVRVCMCFIRACVIVCVCLCMCPCLDLNLNDMIRHLLLPASNFNDLHMFICLFTFCTGRRRCWPWWPRGAARWSCCRSAGRQRTRWALPLGCGTRSRSSADAERPVFHWDWNKCRVKKLSQDYFLLEVLTSLWSGFKICIKGTVHQF